ncbi:hypothetical protein NH44784_042251 [Achromobacter xylosoxidans NH44784-1996]|nr:hypothetical protein NH44784_042251 [Achromobacter xylosoxidans NH44784-1996]
MHSRFPTKKVALTPAHRGLRPPGFRRQRRRKPNHASVRLVRIDWGDFASDIQAGLRRFAALQNRHFALSRPRNKEAYYENIIPDMGQ